MAKPLVTGLGFVCLLLAGAWAQAPSTHEHSFSGAEHWAKVFDDPARDSWQRPHEVIQTLGLAADAVVADIGAGTGLRARRENLQNVTPLLAEPSDPMLPAPVDLALLVDTYHHIGDRVAYFRRLKGHLKPAGTVAIIDFTADSPIGPPAAGRVAPDEVKKEMSRAGYALASEHKFLPNQYFLVFRPN